jgi:L,D-transpeptidase YcbB
MKRVLRGTAGCVLALALTDCSRRQPSPPAETAVADTAVAAALRAVLDAATAPTFVVRGEEGSRLWSDVRRFYRHREDAVAWFRGGKSGPQAKELVKTLGAAPQEGLDAADYELGKDAALVQPKVPSDRRQGASASDPPQGDREPRDLAIADAHLTYAFMRLASHLLTGQVDPRRLDTNWVGEVRRGELADLLDRALDGSGVAATLESLKPKHPQYRLLREALKREREIAARGGWPVDLPRDKTLRKGDRGRTVARLHARLQASGELAENGPLSWLWGGGASERFDDRLAKALQQFQARHGLEPDGTLNDATAAALNVPVEQRVQQVELNLERWRWLPEDLGARYLIVNVPTYSLEGFEKGRRTLKMRVATGTKDHPTPIFAERMTQVIFFPYWNIPSGIARDEWFPEVIRDPDYLRENNLEILKGDRVLDPREVDWNDSDLRLRQRPGASNVLGLVKFEFPNRYNVYLHDTPETSAFHRASRDFSHGCVRIEKPVDLAEWVLREQREWSRARIEEAMKAGVERRVKVEPPFPVYIVYQTAWVEDDGTLTFGEDVYGHDPAQLALLAASRESPPGRASIAREPPPAPVNAERPRSALDGE